MEMASELLLLLAGSREPETAGVEEEPSSRNGRLNPGEREREQGRIQKI